MAFVSASNEKVICRKVCFKQLTKFQVKKSFDRPRRLLPGSVGFFLNMYIYDEFHVPDVLIVLLYKQKQPFKLSISDFLKLYPATL